MCGKCGFGKWKVLSRFLNKNLPIWSKCILFGKDTASIKPEQKNVHKLPEV